MAGRTNYVAWGPTLSYLDMADFFVEEIKDDKYKFGGEWRDLIIKEEVFSVKG